MTRKVVSNLYACRTHMIQRIASWPFQSSWQELAAWHSCRSSCKLSLTGSLSLLFRLVPDPDLIGDAHGMRRCKWVCLALVRSIACWPCTVRLAMASCLTPPPEQLQAQPVEDSAPVVPAGP